ncbi:unnamed protein product [Protopolystoma xenopodis]|uniref:Uncharacterized protein n=1 Tax=Protopolystoma xenopodis TaxID=117903 RepID=A0A3S5AKZ4_9PLAT|nr:unnamed protein product [Protopolystoma xenopodis]
MLGKRTRRQDGDSEVPAEEACQISQTGAWFSAFVVIPLGYGRASSCNDCPSHLQSVAFSLGLGTRTHALDTTSRDKGRPAEEYLCYSGRHEGAGARTGGWVCARDHLQFPSSLATGCDSTIELPIHVASWAKVCIHVHFGRVTANFTDRHQQSTVPAERLRLTSRDSNADMLMPTHPASQAQSRDEGVSETDPTRRESLIPIQIDAVDETSSLGFW